MSLALKLVLAPLLVAQAVATRKRAPRLPEAAGPREGRVGGGGGALRVGSPAIRRPPASASNCKTRRWRAT